MHKRIFLGIAALLVWTLPAWAGDIHVMNIHVTGAWMRLPPGGFGNAAVYFTIVNSGAAADRLVSASSPIAAKVTLHETMSGHGMAGMKDSGPVAIAPGATVIFKPLGRHVMLSGLKMRLYEGASIALALSFEHAGTITVPVAVVAADASPSASQ